MQCAVWNGSFASGARRAGREAARAGMTRWIMLPLLGLVAGLASNATAAAARTEIPRPVRTPDMVKPAVTTTTATLSTLWFDFGDNLVNNKVIKNAVVVKNTGSAPLTLAPAISGDTSYSIVSTGSCGSQLAAGASCDIVVRYLPTKGSFPNTQDAMLSMNFGNAAAGVPAGVLITGTSAVLKVGAVTHTGNSLVAQYTMRLPFPGRMRVNFGPTTSYGRSTWFQETDVNQEQVSILVAGMMASSTYHMSAWVELKNGIIVKDVDHTFKTGIVPGNVSLPTVVSTTQGMTPQPGIEMTNPLRGLVAYDLQGNIIWYYLLQTPTEDYLQSVKPLPNGDFLFVMGSLNNQPLLGPLTLANINEIREIDLAGNVVKEVSIEDVNASLQTATCKECQDPGGAPLVLQTFHHDVTPLPNGHWLLMSNELRNLSATSTPPLTNMPATTVAGDVVVDLDENLQPVWVWNEFNHLDPNRHPYQFPDWTHSNAILYSPDDGNFLISIRHQNWVLKVDYHNGSGSGDILWHLGYQGDFKLIGGSSPVDWQYAQHGPGFDSPNSSGLFKLVLMDNGDDRVYPATNACTTAKTPAPSCFYSTIPVFQIDEKEMTATLTFHHKMPHADYNTFGGNALELENGNIEYDLCGIASTSLVQEVTQEKNPQVVWSMTSTNGNFYRAFRVPSLYPGVTWK